MHGFVARVGTMTAQHAPTALEAMAFRFLKSVVGDGACLGVTCSKCALHAKITAWSKLYPNVRWTVELIKAHVANANNL